MSVHMLFGDYKSCFFVNWTQKKKKFIFNIWQDDLVLVPFLAILNYLHDEQANLLSLINPRNK